MNGELNFEMRGGAIVRLAEVVNNLTTEDEGYALDARQGKVLKTAVDAKLAKSDVANNLTTTTSGKALDARQGKALKTAVDAKLDAADVVANLTTSSTGKALDASQGRELANSSLRRFGTLENDTNINSLAAQGIYFLSSGNTYQGTMPTGVTWGTLLVLRPRSDDTQGMVNILITSGGAMYSRIYVIGTGWSSWTTL